MFHFLPVLLLGWVLVFPVTSVAAEPPALLLAEVYRNQVDVSRYLVSEKLDGVRAIWDGQTLRFRSGREINAPSWFVDGLPQRALDGELWMGRGSFERLSAAVRRQMPDEAEWRQVRYMIFELPGAAGDFRTRAALIGELVTQVRVPWLQKIEQVPVSDRGNLQKMLKEVVKGGGEGLMLHRADALYETGRSDILLKVKPWEDSEAIVVGYLPGKGKHAGSTGALRVKMPDGKLFSLGSGLSDELRKNPPQPGTVVTYRYRDLTRKGLPRFASFLRVHAE